MINHRKNFVLLETLRKDKDNSQNLLFTDPLDIIVCTSPDDIQACFRKMERYRQKGCFLAGFFSYELGYFLEDTLTPFCPRYNYPLFWFGVYKQPVQPAHPESKSSDMRFYLSEPILDIRYPSYERAIHKIKKRIACGETYQINYTSRYHFNVIGNVSDFYNQLKTAQQVSYSALINHDGHVIVSLSPELFFRIDAKQNITVKPMKGTAPLDTPASWLQNDAKNLSENVMIVDLLRNDLGRICLSGSVKVKKLFDVEKYETLQQMTSTVTGKLKTETSIGDLISSLFPCGSVTGAPKIQSMKIIAGIEKSPRNVYTGAIGYFAPDGQAVFNVAIRTIDMQRQHEGIYRAQMGVGGGIVYDSRPEEEFAECRLKADFLQNSKADFALIETMPALNGKIPNLGPHLRRLKASADYFSVPCPTGKIKERLKTCAEKWPAGVRLRLLVQSNGEILLENAPLPAPAQGEPVIAISPVRTQSPDPFLRHKTTRRKQYDDGYRQYAARGFFDVIFLNEKEQVTEGAISNIFIQVRGRWYTPPVSCGLLNGIQRQILIKKWKATEKILSLQDLKKADQIVLTNAVRGITSVRLYP
ncbi:MAG: aminodeoxychorismate synthase component I [Smithellaceae bacterium]